MSGMSSRRWGVRRGASTSAAVAVALVVAACSMDISTGPGEQVRNRFKLTVKVTNVGNGFGHVDVVFPAGTVQNPCPEVLGPGESCSPSVSRAVRTGEVDLEVEARPGSRFVGWGDFHCTGTSTECTVVNESSEPQASIEVEPRFDLIDGGSGG